MSQYGFHCKTVLRQVRSYLLTGWSIKSGFTAALEAALNQCRVCGVFLQGWGRARGWEGAPGGTGKQWEQATGKVEEQVLDSFSPLKARLALNCILCRTHVFHGFPTPPLPKSTFQKQVLQIIHWNNAVQTSVMAISLELYCLCW